MVKRGFTLAWWLVAAASLLSLGSPLAQAPASTASASVTVLPDVVMLPGIGKARTLRLYLPPHYEQSQRRYPVLYMFDGQNLFDVATGYAGEWQVDEQLDQLAKAGELELIVVGIDHGGERRNQELSPFDHPEIGRAQGQAFIHDVVNVIKPWVDSQYRTQPDAAHTGVMGSSLGGLMAHYAGQQYPQVFGRVGVLSPSYWVAPSLTQMVTPTPAAGSRWLISMGTAEGGSMVPDSQFVASTLRHVGSPYAMSYQLIPAAMHREAAWQARFIPTVRYLFGHTTNP